MDIESWLPYEGKVVLRNKQARAAMVRIPGWLEMDEVHRYFQMGAFEGYAQTHTFEKGTSLEEQERWLREVEVLCQEAGIAYVVRRTEQDGEQGYEFGFANMTDCVAFVHNVFGDLEAPGRPCAYP